VDGKVDGQYESADLPGRNGLRITSNLGCLYSVAFPLGVLVQRR
jgi:hypothetical protein